MTAVSPQFFGPSVRTVASVQIATSTGGLSDVIHLQGWSLASVTPSTGWTAADITVLAGVGSTATMNNLYDSNNNEYTISGVAASRTVLVPVIDFRAFDYLQFRSGTNSTSVAQGAVRTLTLGLIR